jgi:HKD family nuclease
MYSKLKMKKIEYSRVSRTDKIIQVFYNKYREVIVKEIVKDLEKAK